jgi:SAM-dependent methyltransferase/uncharacterized protein YbaR (Trm112 family)
MNKLDRISKILACPNCKSHVSIHETEVRCVGCDRVFRVEKGIPVMMVDRPHNPQYVLVEPSTGTRLLERYPFLRPPNPRFWTPAGRQRIPGFLAEVSAGKCVLNVGSRESQYSNNIINLDIEPYQNVDLVGAAEELPLLDDSVDGVIIQAVLEHVQRPAKAVQEIYRVLRPGGMVYAEIPFFRSYHGAPADFQRYTISGIEELFHEFEVVRKGVIAGPASGITAALSEFLAMLFSFKNVWLFKMWFVLLRWLLTPIKYLDLYLETHPFAHRIACTLYYQGRKPSPVSTDRR